MKNTTEDSAALARRLRELRKKNGLSLQDLAQRSGVSVGSLSQIERSVTQPSLRSLQKIGNALGVPISWLFDDARAESELNDGVVIRCGQGAVVQVAKGLRKTLLTPLDLDGLQIIRVELQPHSQSGGGAYTHEGQDAGLVISGSLNLEVDGRIYVLAAGDSFAFDSRKPHRFENRGGQVAEVIWVNTQKSLLSRGVQLPVLEPGDASTDQPRSEDRG